MKKFLPLLILVLLIVSGVAFGLSQSNYLKGSLRSDEIKSITDSTYEKTYDLQSDEIKSITDASYEKTYNLESEEIQTTYKTGNIAESIKTTNLSDLTKNDGATLLYSYCYDNIDEYTGDNTDVETAYQSTFETCQYMLAAEEAMESSENALTSTKNAANNNDKESADAAAEVTQEYADAAAGYAKDARNAADKADDAADKINEVHLDIDTTAVDLEDLSTIKTIEPKQAITELDNTNQYNWLNDLNTWKPDTTVDPDYINDAKTYFENTLSSTDLQVFQQEDAYYAFLVTVYAEAMETNPNLGQAAIADAYESNTLGVNQYQNYSAANSAMIQTLQNNFRY